MLPKVAGAIRFRGVPGSASVKRALKLLAIALGGYLAIVVVVESLVSFMGMQHAERGVEAGESWSVLRTTGADGAHHDTVVAAVERDGRLYVSANHWPRAWFRRAIANPAVEVTRRGQTAAYRAAPVAGEENARVAQSYELPLLIRVLSGFPPMRILRLDPR